MNPPAERAIAGTPLAYMPQLDALRAFAVLAVLIHHYLGKDTLLRSLDVPWGFLGVRLFFVLSGFLITGILLRARNGIERHVTNGGTALKQFYIRRFLRIFPLYYFVVFALALIDFGPVRELFGWLVTYTLNIKATVDGWFPTKISHLWTLAVEEQFYIVWPWVVLFAPRRWLVPLTVAMILMGPLYRAAAIAAQLKAASYYAFTLSSFDSLGMGALLAIASSGSPPLRKTVDCLKRTALPLGLCIAASMTLLQSVEAWGPIAHVVLYDTGASLVFCWLVAAAAHGFSGAAGKIMIAQPLTYCGRIAYGIYMYHALLVDPIYDVARSAGLEFAKRGYIHFALGVLISVAIAALSWHAFERPLNELKRFFPYTRGRSTKSDQYIRCTAPE